MANPDIQMGTDNYAGAETSLHAAADAHGNWSGDTVLNVDTLLIQQPLQVVHGIRAVGQPDPRQASQYPLGERGVLGIGLTGVVGQGTVGVLGQVGGADYPPPLPPNLDNAPLLSSGVVGASFGGEEFLTAGITGQSDVGYGVYGSSQIGGVLGVAPGGAGVYGHCGGPGASPFTAVGVYGEAGGGNNNGIQGNGSGTAAGVSGYGDTVAGIGVFGEGGKGVLGYGTDGVGVYGMAGGGNNNGVEGHGNGTSAGVAGFGDSAPNTAPAGAVGVFGEAGTGNNNGIEGHTSGKAAGVAGFGDPSRGGIGVQGEGLIGVQAISGDLVGIHASNLGKGFFAGWFDGPVFLNGDLFVTGKKSAAVDHQDGSRRVLYSLESPESWFEDFGEGSLVQGKTKVKLEPGFASVIKANSFHVFLTPYGDSNGLYVSQRGTQGFEVREQGGGKASIRFSYRIVGKRKDIKGERLAKIALPKVKPQQFVSKPPVKLKQASPALPKRLALSKVKARKIVTKGRRQT